MLSKRDAICAVLRITRKIPKTRGFFEAGQVPFSPSHHAWPGSSYKGGGLIEHAEAIRGIPTQDPAQVRLPKYDHVVETFPSDGADQPLDVRILPRRSGCSRLGPMPMARNRCLKIGPYAVSRSRIR